MLAVSQLSKSFAGRALFDDVSLQVNRGDRIGLVGPNGLDNGTIAIEKNATIGFLPQETAFQVRETLSAFVGGNDEPVFDCRNALEHRLRFCRTQVGWRLARRLRCRTKVQYTAVGEWW